MSTYKSQLLKRLKSMTSDQREEVMEFQYNFRNEILDFEDLSEEDCLNILNELKDYEREGCLLQGEPIRK